MAPGAQPSSRLKLPKARRLLHSRDFQEIRVKGQRLVKGCLIANWMPASGSFSRVGVISSKKVGNAVKRSRARRVMREVFRQHQQHFKTPTDLTLVARPSISEKQYTQVESDFLRIMREAGLI
jgi:ribonuclease P protein component